MHDWAVAAGPRDTILTLTVGSCIGVVLKYLIRRVAGLAHVMLPEARPRQAAELPAEARGRFADLAVDALLDGVLDAGGRKLGLEAAVVGGAHMFSFGAAQLDVGARNDATVRAGLA